MGQFIEIKDDSLRTGYEFADAFVKLVGVTCHQAATATDPHIAGGGVGFGNDENFRRRKKFWHRLIVAYLRMTFVS
jgi:hypothetical protein